MGILNKKVRIVDTKVTPVGRNNISKGNLGIKFFAVTDSQGMYIGDDLSDTHDKEFKELCMEPVSSYQDEMFFNTDSTGKNVRYVSTNYIINEDGTVFDINLDQNSRSKFITGSSNVVTTTLGEDGNMIAESAFTSIAGTIINESFQNLQNKFYLKNKQKTGYKEFSLDKNNKTFFVTRNTPIKSTDIREIDVNTAEPMFFDQFISNTKSFQFMPPVFPKQINNGSTVGEYTDLNQRNIDNFDDVMSLLDGVQSETFEFTKTSSDSNVILQMFEVIDSNGTVIKLDTLDFREFVVDNKYKKVIFAGKSFIDDYGYPTYINFFTLIMGE